MRIHGAGTTEAGTAVAAIGTDVYVAGTVTNASPDILLVKYHGNGDTVWSRVLNLDLSEKTVGVVVGPDSAPVVCVAVQSLPTKLSLVKFNKNGDTVWTRHRVGFNPTGVALNASNEVFVFGSSGVSTPYDSLALLRYSAGGALMFDNTRRLGPSHTSAGCAVDGIGNLIGAVSISGHSNLLKFDGIGDTLWRRQYPGTGRGEFQGVAVAPNNCIVVGHLEDSILHVVKFAPDGSQLWNESFPGHGAPGTYCNVVVDADSNIMAPVTDDQQFGRVMVLNAQGQRSG